MSSPFFRILALASTVCLPGCSREKIEVYKAPKDVEPALPSAMPAANPHAPAGLKLNWTTPKGWQSQPAAGMRLGSFLIQNPGGPPTDVSIVILPGAAGGPLENVNRWRDQMELPPISESSLRPLMQKISIAGKPALLVELTSSHPVGKPSQPTRILAAILTDQASSCFFKMMGETSHVARQKDIFLQFLQSVHIVAPSPHQGDSTSIPLWDIPKGWEKQPTKAMRKASFLVRGPNHTQADVSVTSLGGSAGGILANINRWRGQIGLAPFTESDLTSQVQRTTIHGEQTLLVNMLGPRPPPGKSERIRILAAILPHGHETWFFKVMGDDSLVSDQERSFLDFLKTVRFP